MHERFNLTVGLTQHVLRCAEAALNRAMVLTSARVESPGYLMKLQRWAVAEWLLSHLHALHDSGVWATAQMLARCVARQDATVLPPQ